MARKIEYIPGETRIITPFPVVTADNYNEFMENAKINRERRGAIMFSEVIGSVAWHFLKPIVIPYHYLPKYLKENNKRYKNFGEWYETEIIKEMFQEHDD